MKGFRTEVKILLKKTYFKDYDVLNDITKEETKRVLKVFGLSSRVVGDELIQETFEKFIVEEIYIQEKLSSILGCEPVISGIYFEFIQKLKDSHLKFLSQLETTKKDSKQIAESSGKIRSFKSKPEENKSNKVLKKKKSKVEVAEAIGTTKRFEKYHKKWSGNEKWSRGDHNSRDQQLFYSDNKDTAEDDDYLSSWLHCLKLGVPWGGRGNGGRGIQRVTGESQNVLVYNISVNRGRVSLLENAILKLNYGRRYALLGENGSGKTTLLRRIATGRLAGFPPYLRVQEVQQELKLDGYPELSDLVPIEFVLKFDFERTLLLKKEAELLQLIEEEKASLEQQNELSKLYAELDYDADNQAERMLRDIGFSKEMMSRRMGELSNGWRMKASLVGAMFTNPDILLLDEPTNHLDIDSIKYLENFMNNKKNFSGTILCVSHDESFINSVCNEIITLKNKQLNYFKGTYQEFKTMQAQARLSQQKKAELLQKERDKVKDLKTITQKDRFNVNKQKLVKMKAKKLERLETVGFGLKSGHKYRIQVDRSPTGYKEYLPKAIDVDNKIETFKFPASSTYDENKLMISITGLALQIQQMLYEPFDLTISGNSRIGIIGPNGCGKSTFLKILTSLKTLDEKHFSYDSSKILRAAALKIGYFSQNIISQLDDQLTPVEFMQKVSRNIHKSTTTSQHNVLDTIEKTRKFLANFGIKGDVVKRQIEILSGGQKCRVAFAMISLQTPDLLILDEPTNHLDIETVEALILAIKDYNGAVLMVSHNRSLLSKTVKEYLTFNPIEHKISCTINESHEVVNGIP